MLWYVGPAKRELTRSRERIMTFRTSVPCVVCLLVTWACGGPVSLPDAKFQIPVPPEAKLVDTTYADTGEDFMGQFRTVSWTLKSPKNLDDVIAFYKQQLPEAEEGETDDGVVFLKSVPADAKPKEKVMIFFYSKDEIRLEQDTLKQQ
jgi:hypothetical protein